MDITERLRDHTEPPLNSQGNPMYRVCYDAADLIESLRQQLDNALTRASGFEVYMEDKVITEALALPSDSTALDSAIRQAKREALLEAADKWPRRDQLDTEVWLRRMADNLKD